MSQQTAIIVLPSGDPSAIGDSSEYTLPNINLHLEREAHYECALIDVSFGNPGITNNSVYILLDFLEYSYIGSNQFQVLYKTEPMIFDQATKPLYYEKEKGTIIQWHKVTNNNINSIKVTIEQSTGEPIDNSQFSTITILIRRIE